LGWFKEIEDGKFPAYSHHIGFLKIALMNGLHLLRAATKMDYTTMLEAVLEEGGDTDTNAAIIGGMFGALNGADGLPKEFKAAVLGHRNPDPKREALFVPGTHFPDLFEKLMAIAPEELEVDFEK
jgi:hypothetical protein